MTDELDPSSPPPSARTANESAADETVVRTFLIADVRGYTTFTIERGDEVAAKLAAKFAEIARETVAARGGSVIELRGDEALAVFASTRQALRAAVDLQSRFLEETKADPSLPLGVGIGVDAGEAVPVEGGYRGGALNLAARLCGQARPGEILASQEAIHLARRIDGIDYRERGALHLKGMREPVRAVAVASATEDASAAFVALGRPAPPPAGRRAGRPRRLSRRPIAAVAAIAVVAALAAAVVLLRPDRTAHAPSAATGATTTGAIGRAFDAGSAAAVRAIRLAAGDGPMVVDGSLWVVSFPKSELLEVDPKDGRLLRSIRAGSPSAVTHGDAGTGRDAVWMADSLAGSVTEVDPSSGKVVATFPVGAGIGALAVGGGYLWAADQRSDTLYRLDPSDGAVRAVHVHVPPAFRDCTTCTEDVVLRGVALGPDGVWVSADASLHNPAFGGSGLQEAALVLVDPSSVRPSAAPIKLFIGGFVIGGAAPVVATGNDVWVASATSNTVYRVDASSGRVTARLKVGVQPSFMTLDAAGTLWVAHSESEDLWRISTGDGTVTGTSRIGGRPLWIAYGDGRIWVPTS